MIRRARLSLKETNQGKLDKLHLFMLEAQRAVRLYIDVLWGAQEFSAKFVDVKVDTWLSARMQQCLGKQAMEIVKSQRKKAKKTKPQFNKLTFNLDSRFIDIEEASNSFDMWIKFSSIGAKLIVKCPLKKHRHYQMFRDWRRKESARLSCVRGEFFVDIYFEKDAPDPKTTGKPLAIDIGYKKLIVTSDNQRVGDDAIYEKIARKKQGSKAFKRALIERDEAINVACKQLPLSEVGVLYVEDLKDVKKGSKGKIHKQFANKLQRWSYPKVLGRLSMLCEEQGVAIIRIPPAYTSQRCSTCGAICKSNRQGGNYKCACGNAMDADYNAALNILHMGEYGPHALSHATIY